jgi:hypothetical protein
MGPDLEVVPVLSDPGQAKREGRDFPSGLAPVLVFEPEGELSLLDVHRPQDDPHLLLLPGREGCRLGGFLPLREPVRDLRHRVGAIPMRVEVDLRTAEDKLGELRPPGKERADRHPDFGLRHRKKQVVGVRPVSGHFQSGDLHPDPGKEGEGEAGKGDLAARLLLQRFHDPGFEGVERDQTGNHDGGDDQNEDDDCRGDRCFPHSSSYPSLAFNTSCTTRGFALPLVSFMTCPTKKERRPALPPR